MYDVNIYTLFPSAQFMDMQLVTSVQNKMVIFLKACTIDMHQYRYDLNKSYI